MSEQFRITLVRGRVYSIKNTQFKRGEPIVVSDPVIVKCAKDAKDILTVSGSDEPLVKAKFDIVALASPKADKAKDPEDPKTKDPEDPEGDDGKDQNEQGDAEAQTGKPHRARGARASK